MTLRGRGRHWTVAAALAATALGAACGGGSECNGFISVNVDATRCESLARQFGCDRFETEGGQCGLAGCVRCADVDEEPTPAPTS